MNDERIRGALVSLESISPPAPSDSPEACAFRIARACLAFLLPAPSSHGQLGVGDLKAFIRNEQFMLETGPLPVPESAGNSGQSKNLEFICRCEQCQHIRNT